MEYGTLGELHGQDLCKRCWPDRLAWGGNGWFVYHFPPGLNACTCECHKNETWLA